MVRADEGLPVQTALGKVIRAIGVKEFGERAGMAGPNVLRAIHSRHNPTQATLNRLLKPFQLRLSLARLEGPEGTHSEKTSSTAPGRQPIARFAELRTLRPPSVLFSTSYVDLGLYPTIKFFRGRLNASLQVIHVIPKLLVAVHSGVRTGFRPDSICAVSPFGSR